MEIASLKTVSHAPHRDGSDGWCSTKCSLVAGLSLLGFQSLCHLTSSWFLVAAFVLPDDKRVLKWSFSVDFFKKNRRGVKDATEPLTSNNAVPH